MVRGTSFRFPSDQLVVLLEAQQQCRSRFSLGRSGSPRVAAWRLMHHRRELTRRRRPARLQDVDGAEFDTDQEHVVEVIVLRLDLL